QRACAQVTALDADLAVLAGGVRGALARREVVAMIEVGEEAEALLQPAVRDAFRRQAQVVANAPGDLAQRDALVPGRVPPGAGRRVLEGQAVEMTDVEGVPGGPPVRSVPGVAGHARFPGDADQGPGEAVPVQRAVGDGRDAHDR